MNKFFIFLIAFIMIVTIGWNVVATRSSGVKNGPVSIPIHFPTAQLISGDTRKKKYLIEPIDRLKERVTKKFFGTKVSPEHSPVSPERFSGYHTGIDLETFADEQDKDVAVKLICDGTLVRKGWVSGYGGVAVERCTINGNAVTVIYGHLRNSSIVVPVGETLHAGDRIGVLGKGYSKETDGERKHLHLAIHKGVTINLRGYVKVRNQLNDWINPLPYFE